MPVVDLKRGDVDLLSRLVWAEARSESFEGQCAVVWVVINRLRRESGRFPKTIAGIVKAPFAFSCFNTSDPQCARTKTIDERDTAFVEATYAVTSVLTGRVEDPTLGSDHYYLSRMAKPPPWRKSMKLMAIIGAHSFLSEKL